MKEEDEIKEIGFRRISKSHFFKSVGKRRFSFMRRLVGSAETVDHYKGIINGCHAYLFGLYEVQGRSAHPTLCTCIKGVPADIPDFLIKIKSFSDEVTSMIGTRKHSLAIPKELAENYEVTSNHEDQLADFLTPEFVSCLLSHGGASIEVLGKDLMICLPLRNQRENYKRAVDRSNDLVTILIETAKERVPTLG